MECLRDYKLWSASNIHYSMFKVGRSMFISIFAYIQMREQIHRVIPVFLPSFRQSFSRNPVHFKISTILDSGSRSLRSLVRNDERIFAIFISGYRIGPAPECSRLKDCRDKLYPGSRMTTRIYAFLIHSFHGMIEGRSNSVGIRI